MPCPYFEPERVKSGEERRGRLPLFDEYDGRCHANGQLQPVSSKVRFAGCNHGHADSGCTVFPVHEGRYHRRFHLRRQTGSTLEILVLDIEENVPVRSHSVSYSKQDEQLQPAVYDLCERAQLLAFCRSYLRRFSHQ